MPTMTFMVGTGRDLVLTCGVLLGGVPASLTKPYAFIGLDSLEAAPGEEVPQAGGVGGGAPVSQAANSFGRVAFCLN